MQTQSGQDELQKAIDDITNANASGTSVSADQPLPMPDPIDVGTLGQMPPVGATADGAAGGAVEAADAASGAVSMGTQPVEEMQLPDMNAPVAGGEAENGGAAEVANNVVADGANNGAADATAANTVNGSVVVPNGSPIEAGEISGAVTDLTKVKADALRDLSPLMDKIEMAPEKKFHIYKEMMMANNDSTVVVPAYEAAKQIGNEQERGEALLSLIEYIDKTE